MYDALFNGVSNDLQCFRFASTYSSSIAVREDVR